jgi:hypothetical protein
MQFDENDVRFQQYPNTLLVSSFNFMRWKEILAAQLIEPTTHGDSTNRPNVFLMDGFSMQLVHSPLLVANTWFVGRAKSGGILTLNPSEIDDPWAFYRDEDNRAYFISFEKEWGFMVRNWRDWCAGAISVDGVTPPAFNGVTEINWDTIPAGV